MSHRTSVTTTVVSVLASLTAATVAAQPPAQPDEQATERREGEPSGEGAAEGEQPAPGAETPPGYEVVVVDYLAPPPHTHDGLFARVVVGLSWVSSSEQTPDGDFGFHGPGVVLAAALGGAVAEGLVLFGEAFVVEVYDPTVSIDGRSVGEAQDATFTLFALGPGLAYYLPSNFHFGLSIGTGIALLDYVGPAGWLETAETDFGFALHGLAGYEWWVYSEMGVGVAVDAFFLSAPDGDRSSEPMLNALSLGVDLTLTYN